MTKKKRSITETANMDEDPVLITLQPEDPEFVNLNEAMKEIAETEGVDGYIIRNSSCATIDFRDQDDVVQRALLASEITDFCQAVTSLFKLGDAESVVVEGQQDKVLCAFVGDNRLDVFMEKSVDHKQITEKILS